MTALQSTYSGPEITYHGFADLVKQIRSTSGDIIMINNVSLVDFTHISSEREKGGLGFQLSLYMADSKQLIVTIPSVVHETLHISLTESIREITAAMGIPRRELLNVGAATFHHDADKSWGEGDSCLQPRICLPYGFPTVVIEAGHTKSWTSLQQKARWWFSVSHFDVKIVILAKFEESGPRITIEKWKAVEGLARPGMRAQAQANAPQYQAACIDTIHITHHAPDNDPEDPASYNVTAPLHLEFVDVYLQEPIEGQGDIVIGIPELQAYAVDFWLINV